jgi:hypothetical protein
MALTTEQMAPGLAETETAARAALPASASKAAAQQQDGRRFIVENGHQVVGGHADVGDGSAPRGRQAGGS